MPIVRSGGTVEERPAEHVTGPIAIMQSFMVSEDVPTEADIREQFYQERIEPAETGIEKAMEIIRAEITPELKALFQRWPLAEDESEARHIEYMYNDPAGFWKDVKTLFISLPNDEQKQAYAETIRNWVHKHVNQFIVPNINPDYYPQMLNAIPLALMGWVTENILHDAIGHYWRMWFVTDPGAFISVVFQHADQQPSPEARTNYVNLIREKTAWYINDLAAQDALAPLFDLVPIDPMIFAGLELYPEHINYMNWRWLIEKTGDWLRKEIEIHKTIEDPNLKEQHKEDVKNMINAAGFTPEYIQANVSPAVRSEFMATFYPEIKISDQPYDPKALARLLGWGAVAIFAIFLISRAFGGRAKGTQTLIIPAPSN